MSKTEKGPIVSAQKNLMPVQVHAQLVTDAKAILISKGVNEVTASQASEAIVNWAFCIFGGFIPCGSVTTMSASTTLDVEELKGLEP